MDKLMGNEILKRLDLLAEKLGVGVQQIFPWFVYQVYINSALSWLFFLVVTTLLVTSGRYVVKHWNPTRKSSYGLDSNEPLIYDIIRQDHEVLWSLVISVLVFVWIGSLICILMFGFDFLNPKLHAFKDILKGFRYR